MTLKELRLLCDEAPRKTVDGKPCVQVPVGDLRKLLKKIDWAWMCFTLLTNSSSDDPLHLKQKAADFRGDLETEG